MIKRQPFIPPAGHVNNRVTPTMTCGGDKLSRCLKSLRSYPSLNNETFASVHTNLAKIVET